jgi:hypothetical protein
VLWNEERGDCDSKESLSSEESVVMGWRSGMLFYSSRSRVYRCMTSTGLMSLDYTSNQLHILIHASQTNIYKQTKSFIYIYIYIRREKTKTILTKFTPQP